MKKLLLTSLLALSATCAAFGYSCGKKSNETGTTTFKYEATESERVNLDEIYLGSEEISLSVGDSYQLRISTDETVVWSVGNEGVATVSSAGVVTAVAEGRTSVHAAVGEEVYSGLIIVADQKTFFSVTLDKRSVAELSVGSKAQINALVEAYGIDNLALEWTVSDESVVEILSADNDGCLVEAKAEGDAVITVRYGNVSAVCSVEVVGEEVVIDGNLAVSAIDSVENIKPSFDLGYNQKYTNNSNYVTTGSNVICSAVGEEKYGKEATYQIRYQNMSGAYYRGGFGIALPFAKEALQYYKYCGLTALSVEICMDFDLYANLGTAYSRYIDVLTDFDENGVGQYTRYAISNQTWRTFTFDINELLAHYDEFTNTTFGSGYAMFVQVGKNNSADEIVTLPSNVRGCGETASNGTSNIGNNYTIYFGEVALSKTDAINPNPYAPKDPADYVGLDSVDVVSSVNGIKPSFDLGYAQQYTNNSNCVTNGSNVICSAVGEEKYGNEASYQIRYQNLSGANYRGGFGFVIPFTKEELEYYKQYSELTTLSVEVCFDLDLYANLGTNYSRYIDVLTDFDENGVGQYTRYAIANQTWRTFTFDIDELIEHYDEYTNTTFGSGYAMFVQVGSNGTPAEVATLPSNVTESGETATNGTSNIGNNYTIYFGDILLTK